MVLAFERSGLSRREFCEQSGIAMPTLDWYRRRVRARRNSPNLVPVKLVKISKTAAPPAVGGAGDGFALVLSNGCRIESGWNFSDAAMSRLIRIAGVA